MSPSRVAETLANGLAAAPRLCDLLADVHLHLEHEVGLDRVRRCAIGRRNPARPDPSEIPDANTAGLGFPGRSRPAVAGRGVAAAPTKVGSAAKRR
jgi:hypothetical protein